jgi:DNA-binding response OmpR family regulator
MGRLLLVDDDPAGLALRKLILERAGHQVFSATDVDSARALFFESGPETVVLDLRLPESKDGLALIRDFRGASPSVRIIVLSGWTPDLEGQPEEKMVDQLLSKPVPSAYLVSVIGA